MAPKKQAIVTLDEEQVKWLESKVNEGYSKSGLIRYAVKRLMTEPNATKEAKPEAKLMAIQGSNELEPAQPAKKVEIEEILKLFIEVGESGGLDEHPKMVEAARSIQQRLKNLDHLQPRTAFELGQFKVEMETAFAQALHRELKNAKS